MVFLSLNGRTMFGYANVAAAYELKGPDKLVRNIWADPNERLLYGAAFAAIAPMFFSARDSGVRSGRRMLICVWILALLALIAASALRHTNTDYPRFSAYLIVPIGVAAAAAVHRVARNPAVVASIAVTVLLLGGQHTMHGFDKATAFYGMDAKSADLSATSDWLNNSAAAGGITGGTREVKWLEALTGRDSLLYLPRIYITRPWEVDSAVAAEVIQRASAGVETGRFLATVNDGGQDSGKVFPVGVRVDIFHKGINTDAFALNDRDASGCPAPPNRRTAHEHHPQRHPSRRPDRQTLSRRRSTTGPRCGWPRLSIAGRQTPSPRWGQASGTRAYRLPRLGRAPDGVPHGRHGRHGDRPARAEAAAGACRSRGRRARRDPARRAHRSPGLRARGLDAGRGRGRRAEGRSEGGGAAAGSRPGFVRRRQSGRAADRRRTASSTGRSGSSST